MAEEQAVLSLGLDSTGFQTGAQSVIRSANEIKATMADAATMVDGVYVSTQTLTNALKANAAAQQQLAASRAAGTGFDDAARAASQASAAAMGALRDEIAEATVVQDAYNKKLAESSELGLAEIEALKMQTGATADAAAAIATIEPSTTNAYGGTNRLIRSMDSLAFSSVGVHGPLSTIVTSLGLMAGGTGVMLAVAASAALLSVAYKFLTQDGNDVATSSQKLVDGLKKQQDQQDQTTRGALLAAQAEAQLVVTHAETLQAQGLVVKDMDLYKQALFAASVNLENFDASQRKSNETSKLTLEVLQQRAAAHTLDAAGWAQLAQMRQQAEAAITDAQTKEKNAAAGSRELTSALTEEHDARATLATITGLYTKTETDAVSSSERARASAADAAIQTQKNSAASLKASGDLVGATQAELAATLLAIDSKAKHEIAISKLTGQRLVDFTNTVNETAAQEKQNATTQASATIEADLAAKRKLFADAADTIAQQAATNSKLQAQLDGDSAKAFDDVYADKIVKIQDTAAKQIAATDAAKNLTLGEKLYHDIQLLVIEGLQQRGVVMQQELDAKKQAATAAATLESAETEYQVAVLKSLGLTTAARDLDTAAKQRAYVASVQLRVGETGPQGLTQAQADVIIGLHNQTAALDEASAKTTTATGTQSNAFKQLGHDIEHALSSSFDNILNKGIDSFTTLVTDIEHLFTKMLADMAAQALTTDIIGSIGKGAKGAGGGPPLSVLQGLGQGQSAGGWTQVADTGAGASPIYQQTGNSTSSTLGTLAIIGTVVATVASSLLASADAAKTAAANLAAAEKSWALTLQQYVDANDASVSALKKSLDTALANLQSLKDKAASTFSISSGGANLVEGMTPAQLAMTAIAAQVAIQHGFGNAQLSINGVAVGTANDVLAFVKALQQVPDAATAAKNAVTAMTKTIDDAYTGSLPGGQNRLTLAGYQTTEQGALADVDTAYKGGLISQAEATRLAGEAVSTYTNQVQSFLKGLSQSDLETLIPTLTGDTLTYAQALDAVLKKTQEATILAANATAAGGLYGRLATATTTTDPTASARYAAEQKAQQQADEIAAATKKRDDDIAAGASDAAIASDNYILSLTKVTQAAENAAAAAKVQADGDAFRLNTMNLIAQASGDSEQIRLANLATLQASQKAQLSAAQQLLAVGSITQGDYQQFADYLNGQFKLAMNSATGTVQAMATAAQILSNNASQLTQQFSVFGTTLADQADTLRKLYGFAGQSDTQIRAQYVTEQNGVDLTPGQKALDDKIAAYFAVENQYLNSIATSTSATASATSTLAAPNLNGAVTSVAGTSTSILGPGATFNITIQIDPTLAKDGPAIVQQVKDALMAQLPGAMDRSYFQRASLVRSALGNG